MTRDLAAAFAAGRSAWPSVNLDRAAFAAHADRLEVRDEDLAAHGGDLYLAWACAAHDAAALAHLERAFLSQVDVYVRRLGLQTHALDELRQELRIRLLLGSAPRIAQYSGRGPLGAWVRIVAIRVAASSMSRKTKEKTGDVDALGALVADRAGPEVAMMRHRYTDAFQVALERSLDALEPREKTILRMHFIDLLNIEAIGRVYRVHRATVARWLVGIRQKVLATLRQELSLELEATSAEFRSMLNVVRDDLGISLRRLGEPTALV
jgi:RNA polymerase sigma-70 factor, ECF subfamily